MIDTKRILVAGLAASVLTLGAHAQPVAPHVLLISVDGMHQIDLQRWIAGHPEGPLAALAARGITYTNAYTTAPSDSFPGLLAQITGGTPSSTGVFYDDSYDRTLFAPGSDCAGKPGAQVDFSETISRSLATTAAGGTLGEPVTQIDTAKLPMQRTATGCAPLLPHAYLRVNTVFDIIHAHGRRTAWADKHPAYEILNGSSGHGVDDLFTPEIAAQLPGAPDGKSYDSSYKGTRDNDAMRVTAVLNQIDGRTSTGAPGVEMPALLGMNFQAVSVGQKLAKAGFGDDPALVGGYTDASATPGNALALQLQFVDDQLGTITAALKHAGRDDDTTIIVSAKHGQSPIDPALIHRIKNNFSKLLAEAGFAFAVTDDVALIWLDPNTRTPERSAAASDILQANRTALGIDRILPAGNPASDARTPDFIVQPKPGVIYTGGSKLAEHGGTTEDDRHVALLVSSAGLSHATNDDVVATSQIAPSILQLLGLPITDLEAAKTEGTMALPGLRH